MIATGLAALDGVLDAGKLRVARRLLLSGAQPTPDALRARGASPSREQLAGLASIEPLATRVAGVVVAGDGARRLVIALADGQRIETVLMGDGGVCLSTQVGCAVGCRFCASGIGGLVRNLTVEELLEQVVHARRLEPALKRVVYMGIGEPTHNLDAVLEAASILMADGDVHERSQTLSTVGSLRALARLREASVRPSLALSVHAARDDLRWTLLPHAAREPIAELVAAAEDHAASTGREVQYATALLGGVNDGDDHADALVSLLDGKRGYVNVIPWNAVAELPFARPSRERAIAFAARLRAGGLFATLRWSAGLTADAACGQLRRGRGASPQRRSSSERSEMGTTRGSSTLTPS
ncbi:MAG: radical SAM protein [Planctomycetes bacterium]|nr:radical SAM protein [Planctomycetota bacterium]